MRERASSYVLQVALAYMTEVEYVSLYTVRNESGEQVFRPCSPFGDSLLWGQKHEKAKGYIHTRAWGGTLSLLDSFGLPKHDHGIAMRSGLTRYPGQEDFDPVQHFDPELCTFAFESMFTNIVSRNYNLQDLAEIRSRLSLVPLEHHLWLLEECIGTHVWGFEKQSRFAFRPRPKSGPPIMLEPLGTPGPRGGFTILERYLAVCRAEDVARLGFDWVLEPGPRRTQSPQGPNHLGLLTSQLVAFFGNIAAGFIRREHQAIANIMPAPPMNFCGAQPDRNLDTAMPQLNSEHQETTTIMLSTKRGNNEGPNLPAKRQKAKGEPVVYEFISKERELYQTDPGEWLRTTRISDKDHCVRLFVAHIETYARKIAEHNDNLRALTLQASLAAAAQSRLRRLEPEDNDVVALLDNIRCGLGNVAGCLDSIQGMLKWINTSTTPIQNVTATNKAQDNSSSGREDDNSNKRSDAVNVEY
ncbi:hypothetical protein NUW58_g2229 [Xylaria curta]|uniref:Uncharacterized protein n=1 Tax=Xylaria curta TaxID=42375 RepID=A0ACC1PIK1_9PEZI|nr:hypothetical protein NUW58_g2229 [Xylaria curta]